MESTTTKLTMTSLDLKIEISNPRTSPRFDSKKESPKREQISVILKPITMESTTTKPVMAAPDLKIEIANPRTSTRFHSKKESPKRTSPMDGVVHL